MSAASAGTTVKSSGSRLVPALGALAGISLAATIVLAVMLATSSKDSCDALASSLSATPPSSSSPPPPYLPFTEDNYPYSVPVQRHKPRYMVTLERMNLCDVSAGYTAAFGGFFNTNEGLGCQNRTHELFFDRGTNSLYVTQLAQSSLLRLELDSNGRIKPGYTRATIGTFGPLSAIHWVSMSERYPGLMWLTTQKDGYVWLVDPNSNPPYRLVKKMKTPDFINTSSGLMPILWPHSLCEAANGKIMVNLQAGIEGPTAPWTQSYMDTIYNATTDTFKNTWASWLIDPEQYDENDGIAHGGVLYQAYPKPVNCARDGAGRVIVAQDTSPYALVVDRDGQSKQIRIATDPVNSSSPLLRSQTGPGAVAAPDGSVWLASIMCSEADGSSGCGKGLRFLPGSDNFQVVDLFGPAQGGPRFAKVGRIIHYAFQSDPNIMFCLTTALLASDNEAPEQVVQVHWDDTWSTFDDAQTTFTSLGTFGNAHRIHYIGYRTVSNKTISSVAVTMWLQDGLYQVFNDTDGHRALVDEGV